MSAVRVSGAILRHVIRALRLAPIGPVSALRETSIWGPGLIPVSFLQSLRWLVRHSNGFCIGQWQCSRARLSATPDVALSERLGVCPGSHRWRCQLQGCEVNV
jgi:hypothetical protein